MPALRIAIAGLAGDVVHIHRCGLRELGEVHADAWFNNCFLIYTFGAPYLWYIDIISLKQRMVLSAIDYDVLPYDKSR